MTRRFRSYTDEFKQEAVKLAVNSVSISATAKELGVPDATLHTWVKKAKRSGTCIMLSKGTATNVNDLLEENKKLHKRLARLEQEKAILKKAATYFAKELG